MSNFTKVQLFVEKSNYFETSGDGVQIFTSQSMINHL